MLRVLIAEDDNDIRETLRYLLEGADYQVEEASDGAAALDRLRGMRGPCVALLDLTMPKMSGVAVLRALANEPQITTHQRYILLTARQATLPSEDAQTLSKLGAPVLYKPFEIDDVLAGVQKAADSLNT